MAGYVHEGDHALIARDCEEVRPRWCGVVHALKTLPAPQSASSIQQPNTRQDHVALLILFAHKAEKTIPSANCAKSCRLREYTRLEEMLSRFESNGFVSQGFDKPRRAPRTQDFAECVAVLLQTRAGRRAGVSGWCTYRESAPVRLTAPYPVWVARVPRFGGHLLGNLHHFMLENMGTRQDGLQRDDGKGHDWRQTCYRFPMRRSNNRLGAHVEAQRSGP